eukprot:GFYU01008483.1.p1 GENE.GFYU01008483.1~~GFYU01008483.1.p1  ORF type:complete len:107 (-),score=13.15 GFYU01008483.1:237-557(-)
MGLRQMGVRDEGITWLTTFTALKAAVTFGLFICGFTLCMEYGDHAEVAVPWMMLASFSVAAFAYQSLRLATCLGMRKEPVDSDKLMVFLRMANFRLRGKKPDDDNL